MAARLEEEDAKEWEAADAKETSRTGSEEEVYVRELADKADGEYSETPRFDAIFMKYDLGDSCFSTESLGSLLLEMGFKASAKVLDQALDDMDPQATGEITKLTFLEWFEQHADDIETPALAPPPQLSSPPSNSSYSSSSSSPGSSKSSHKSPRKRHPHRHGLGSDDSFQELTSAMLEAKNQRKQTEQDVLQLKNRLSHLRAQEKKVLKHIEGVNERAKEIQRVHKRNADHKKLREALKAEALQEIQKSCCVNLVTTRDASARKRLIAEQIVRQNAQAVQLHRLESKQMQSRIEDQVAQERKYLQDKMRQVKQQQQQALEKRAHVREQHHKQLVKQAQQKLAAEHSQRIYNERIIHKLEQEELKLIERLRQTQEMQLTACDNLETLLRTEPSID